jgi:hypothetical protein
MQTLHESNDYAMENYKTIQIVKIAEDTDAKQGHSSEHPSPIPAPKFDVIEFIKEPGNDYTFLLALVR